MIKKTKMKLPDHDDFEKKTTFASGGAMSS